MGKKKKGGGGKNGGKGGGGDGGQYYYYTGGHHQHQHTGMDDDLLYRLFEEMLREAHKDRRSWLQRMYARIQTFLRNIVRALFPTRSEYEQRRPRAESQERQGKRGEGGGPSEKESVQKQEPEVSCFAVLGLEPTGEGVTEDAVKRAYR